MRSSGRVAQVGRVFPRPRHCARPLNSIVMRKQLTLCLVAVIALAGIAYLRHEQLRRLRAICGVDDAWELTSIPEAQQEILLGLRKFRPWHDSEAAMHWFTRTDGHVSFCRVDASMVLVAKFVQVNGAWMYEQPAE